jgi:hypothetical protein
MAAWLNHFNDTWLLYAMAAVTLLFPVLYIWFVRRQIRSALAWAVLSLSLATALLVLRRLLLVAVGLPPLAGAIFTTTVFLVVIIAYVVKTVTLITIQIRGYRPPGGDESDAERND